MMLPTVTITTTWTDSPVSFQKFWIFQNPYLMKLLETNKTYNKNDTDTIKFFSIIIIIMKKIGVPGSIIKGLIKGQEELEIKGRVETIQTIALLKSARILRTVLDIWGDLLSLRL